MAFAQNDPQARALEAEADRLCAIYDAKAKVVGDLWKKCSKIVFLPDSGKAVRMMDEKAPDYPKFAVAQMEKDEAHAEWQRAAYRHGNSLVDLK